MAAQPSLIAPFRSPVFIATLRPFSGRQQVPRPSTRRTFEAGGQSRTGQSAGLWAAHQTCEIPRQAASDSVVEVRLWDKLRALEMLAKHFALLTERLEHGGEVVFRWQSD
jgi:hypothetical protein